MSTLCASSSEHFNPPLCSEDRVKQLVLPFLSNIGRGGPRKVDMVEVGLAAWDLMMFKVRRFSSARPFSTLDASSPKPARSDPVLGSSFRRRKTRCLSPITSPPSLPTPPQSPTSCLSPRPSPPNLSPRRDSTGTRPGSTRSSPTSSRPSLQPRPPASPRPTCLGSACGCRLCRCVDSFPSRPPFPLVQKTHLRAFLRCLYIQPRRTYLLPFYRLLCVSDISLKRTAGRGSRQKTESCRSRRRQSESSGSSTSAWRPSG